MTLMETPGKNPALKILCAALWLALAISSRAGSQGSADYSFGAESVDGGGSRATSADYSGDNSLGAGGFISSSDYVQRGGYVGQLNNAPVAGVLMVQRTVGLRLKIALSDVAAKWSDADGDAVALAGINLVTTNFVNLTTNGTFIFYTNSPNVNDQLNYSIRDSEGDANSGLVNIVVNPFVTGQQSGAFIVSGNSANVTFYAIPGFVYVTQRATNLVSAAWVNISTNTVSANGLLSVTDNFGDLGGNIPASAYYRLGWSP
jgi:hypothetical protein